VPKILWQLQEALKERGCFVKGTTRQPGLTRLVELVSPPKGSVCFSDYFIPSDWFVDELCEG